MSDAKPHHQLVLWTVEHAPETDRNLLVEVCPEAFDHLLREGMEQWPYGPEALLVRHRQGHIELGNGRFVLVSDSAEPADVVLFWEGEPFYTLQLTAHQKVAFAAMCEAARKKGVAP